MTRIPEGRAFRAAILGAALLWLAAERAFLPGLIWIYAWELDDMISIAGSTAGDRALDEATAMPYFELTQTAVMGFSLTDRIGAYAEWFAFFPHSADTAKPEHYFDGGITFSVTNNFHLDVRGGVGLNENADDYFLGTGAIIRH